MNVARPGPLPNPDTAYQTLDCRGWGAGDFDECSSLSGVRDRAQGEDLTDYGFGTPTAPSQKLGFGDLAVKSQEVLSIES